jgi:hypothetical protein
VINFDQWWNEDERPAPAGNLTMCPDGRHTGEITKALFKDLKFKVSDQNPTGTSLVLEVQIPGHYPVEAIIPAQYRGLIEAVCRAARVDTPAKGEDWDETQLVDQVVAIETVLGVGKTGKEFIRIDRWHPAAAPLPKALKATPARTPAAKVEAAAQGGVPDDIPF